MSKRQFRDAPTEKQADYPTLDEFDRTSRRSFLTRLAGAALGAGALAALAGCGSRVVGAAPDTGKRLDGGPEPQLDGPIGPSGAAPLPDAQVDHRRPEPDSGQILGGEAPLPDAQIDKADLEAPLGKQRMPDARCDSECPLP